MATRAAVHPKSLFPRKVPEVPAGVDIDMGIFLGEVVEYLRRIRDAILNKDVNARVFNDATRPLPGDVGRIIFNTDDGQLNIDDGLTWTLPDGTST